MFYDEKLINGVLYFKTTPHGSWEPLSHAELSKRLLVMRDIRDKYNELLYSVANCFPDESRHDTALRCIRNAEKHDNQLQCDAAE